MKFLFLFLFIINLWAVEPPKVEGLKAAHTVVIFISKDCPCSQANLNYLNELSKEYSEFDFIGVHAKKGTTELELQRYLMTKNLRFPVLLDSDQKITTDFNALKTPHVFIVNRQGTILYNGGVTKTTRPEETTDSKGMYLKNALNDLRENHPIKESLTKTMGCYIVR